MPEKWRKELSKLPRLEDPDAGWRRAQQGPERPLPRPGTGQRVAAGLVALVVFAGGLALAVGAFRGGRPADEAAPAAPVPVVISIFVDTESGYEYPNSTMQTGESVVQGNGSSYGWLSGDVGTEADTFGTEFQFETWTEVMAGAPILVEGDAETVLGWVGEWHEKDFEVVRLADLWPEGATMPTEPGRYVLEFSASWPQGGRSFYFPVDVVGEPQSEADQAVLTLRSASTKPDARLAWQGKETEGVFGSFCWEQETVAMCAYPFLAQPQDFFAITAGTVIELDSDAISLDASLAPHGSGGGPLFFDAANRVEFPLVLDVGLGRYILAIQGSWPQGDVPIYFPIEVVPQEGVTPPPSETVPTSDLVVTLDAPDNGDRPSITFAYEGHEKTFIGCGGRWNDEPGACLAMLLVFGRTIDPGTLLRVEGDAEEVEASLVAQMSDGRWEQDAITLDLSDGSAPLPTTDGFYLLGIGGTWPQGQAGTSVAFTIGDPPEHTEPPLPDVEVGVVPDLVGINAGDAGKLLWQAGLEEEVVTEPVPGVAGGLVVSTDPPAGTEVGEGTTVTLVVSGTTVALDGYLTPLACPMEDMMPFDEDFGDQPGGGLFIRLNVAGVDDTDEVIQASTDPNLWHVVRDDDVLAVIDYQTLEGVACRGSGIGGT